MTDHNWKIRCNTFETWLRKKCSRSASLKSALLECPISVSCKGPTRVVAVVGAVAVAVVISAVV